MFRKVLLIAILFLIPISSVYGGDEPVLWYELNKMPDDTVFDFAGGKADKVLGKFRYVDGVNREAMVFDGQTTRVVREAASVPQLVDALSIEAWIAPQTYSWSWTGIVSQGGDVIREQKGQVGYDRGLYGTKYHRSYFENPEGKHILSTFDNVWTGGANDWAGRWRGVIESPVSGEVTFSAQADNGVKLIINGKVVIDGWGRDKGREGKIVLEKGKKYPIELHYFQDGDPSFLKLFWSWEGQDKAIVDSGALMHSEEDIEYVKVQWLEEEVAEKDREDRIFFGIDCEGRVGLRLSLNGKVEEVDTDRVLDLLKWAHVAATFDQTGEMKIYVNGQLKATKSAKGLLTPGGHDLYIGKNQLKMSPKRSERKASAGVKSQMIFDGLIDEVKIYDRALSESEIAQAYASSKPVLEQPLKYRQMPTGPKNVDRFGAFYTTLKYSPQWDQHWRIGPDADIVVTFDNSPVNMIFWHGTAYGAVWAAENGKLMGDQSLERSNSGKSKWGCSEHMSDKQCRYSHVRLIENNKARAVIHWRYAISDIMYEIFGIKENNDPFGEWGDEYYYIYPDGVSTRYQILWTKKLSHEWQETIVLHQPGTIPEDNIEIEAMTFANMKGQEHTYSWESKPKRGKMKPDEANIQIVNLKSEYKPFIIFEPDNGIKLATGGIEPWCHYPWWNHWPAGQVANDGRRTAVADRPGHSSLSQSLEESGAIHRDKENPDKYWAVTLIGMTNKKAGELAPLARSWNTPAKVEKVSKGYMSRGYDIKQRAYVFDNEKDKASKLKFELAGNEENVVYNPAFVIKNWGRGGAEIYVNGKKQTDSKKCRVGHNHTINGSDLVLWLEMENSEAVEVEIHPEKSGWF